MGWRSKMDIEQGMKNLKKIKAEVKHGIG